MEKTNNLPGRRIILFGQQNLQNSILIGFIHQRTNIDCQLVSQPQCVMNGAATPVKRSL